MDLVGCMIGFYVYSASSELCKESVLNHRVRMDGANSQLEIKFVPWNETSEVIELDYNPDGYMIMCATYDPQKIGPFILSLSTEVDFTLTPS